MINIHLQILLSPLLIIIIGDIAGKVNLFQKNEIILLNKLSFFLRFHLLQLN